MTSQRILLIGGLLLFLSGICYAMFYHVFLEHAYQQSLLYNLDMSLNMAVKGDFEAASAFAVQYSSESAANTIHSRIPIYLMLAGTLTALLLIASRHIEASERMQRIFSLLVVLGGFVLASGEIITVYGPEKIGFITSLGGYSWIFFGLFGYIIYTVLFMWLHETPKTSRNKRERSGIN